MMKNSRTVFLSAGILSLGAVLLLAFGAYAWKWPQPMKLAIPVIAILFFLIAVIPLRNHRDKEQKSKRMYGISIIISALAFFLAAVPLFAFTPFLPRSSQDSPDAASADSPTEISPPSASPSPTPDPMAAIDLQDPATFPAWLGYWTSLIWPEEADQIENSSRMLTLYRNLLLARDVNIAGLSDYQIYFMAARAANAEGWSLPGDLALTRAMYAGPQGAVQYTESGIEDGIYDYGFQNPMTPFFAQTSGMITTNTFGVDVRLHRTQDYWRARAPEGALVEVASGKFVMILHYTNIDLASGLRQDYFFPLAVLFQEAVAPARIGNAYPYGPDCAGDPVNCDNPIPPAIYCGYMCPWTEETLRSALVTAGLISAEASNCSPLLFGLEDAYFIRVYPPSTPEAASTP